MCRPLRRLLSEITHNFLTFSQNYLRKHLQGTLPLHPKFLTEFYYLAAKEVQLFGNKGMKTSIARFYMLVKLAT
jgi:hypothetical protein